MQEIDKRIALLRLMLADIESREQQRSALTRQYTTQRRRIVEATVHHAGDLTQALQALREVEERLAEVEQSGKHLEMIRTRASTELEALLLTKRVAEAKAQLSELETRQLRLENQLAALGVEPAPKENPLLFDSAFNEKLDFSDTEPTPHEEAELRELNDQVQSEIQRLHKLIQDASQRAARNITLRDTARSQD